MIETITANAFSENALSKSYDFSKIKEMKSSNIDSTLLASDNEISNYNTLMNGSLDIESVKVAIDDTLVADAKTFISDKTQTFIYEGKGLINDFKCHQFYDPKGHPLPDKMTISDVVGNQSVKMPYIGSDMSNANAAGFLRDAKQFWTQYSEKYPDVLSDNNLELITNGKSPLVDKKWLSSNPNQKEFLGEKLEHHHRNNTDMAYAVPQSLHRGKYNKDVMHVN